MGRGWRRWRMFADRVEGGRRLAELLEPLRGQDVVVLGLPRGGVPVAFEVATALDLPLDVIVVRKLGVPFQPELAMGAIGEGGAGCSTPTCVGARGSPRTSCDARRAAGAARARRDGSPGSAGVASGVDLTGRVAVVVDDGIATGSTARVACEVARHLGAARVVLAVPVAPLDSRRASSPAADEVVCVSTPAPLLRGRAATTADFSPDQRRRGDRPARRRAAPARRPAGRRRGADCDVDVEIPVAGATALCRATCTCPSRPAGVVVFAHGSGSSRHSPRNRYVAAVLQRAGLGTLLFDLLTPAEERRPRQRLRHRAARRPAGRRDRLAAAPARTRPRLPVGYFGASTGAAAALGPPPTPAPTVARGRLARRAARPGRRRARRRCGRRRC